MILIVIVILIVVLKSVLSIGGGSSNSAVVLREAPHGLKPVDVGSSVTSTSQSGTNMRTQTISLKDVKYGGDATATATRSYGGGLFILTVNATLPDPKNTYYQVWLVGSNGPVPIDFMQGSGTSWSLTLRDQDKFSQNDGIWITLQRAKDNKVEEHVMEGSF